MKKYFSVRIFRLLLILVPAAAGMFTTACKKDSATVTTDYSAIDDAIIQKYLADSSITNAQKQPSGLYYVPKVTNANGVRATAGKTVYVYYKGRLMDGTVFDKTGTAPFPFVLGRGRVIAGWDEGIALMHKGDKGKLLIPSAMGYGSAGAGSVIPPNAVLCFDVEVNDVL